MRRADIERLLPQIYQRAVTSSPLLAGYLDAMEILQETVESKLRGLDQFFDPRRAPEPFVHMLARWLVASRLDETSLERTRELTAGASRLARVRGTREQLAHVLTLATGVAGIRLLENLDVKGQPRAFHLLVQLPAAAAALRPAVETLVANEIPAHLTFEVTVDSEPAS